MADLPPNNPLPGAPTGAEPLKKSTGKVQPKKETVRINLPPKPTAAPTIKLPTLPPGGPTGAPNPAFGAPPTAMAPPKATAAPVAAAAAPATKTGCGPGSSPASCAGAKIHGRSCSRRDQNFGYRINLRRCRGGPYWCWRSWFGFYLNLKNVVEGFSS
jgi:hypothetical protein